MIFDYSESVTRQEALEILRNHWSPEPVKEFVSLEDSIGRYAAEDVFALYDSPINRTSAFDGIAVSAKKLEEKPLDFSAWKLGREFVRADTGDDFPDCFDTVIAIEDVELEDDRLISITPEAIREASENPHTRPAGSVCQKGEKLLSRHTKITPMLASMLVLGGHRQIPVIRKPRLVYIPTGDELIGRGEVPYRGQTFESNSMLVKGMAEEMGAEFFGFPIIRDDREALEKVLDDALMQSDIVIINGGSSRGSEDFNSELLREKASVFRHGIRAAPGRPVGIAVIENKPVINMPGPPIATFIALDWCIRGLIAAYLEAKPLIRPTITAKLADDLWKKQGHEMYYLFDITGDNGEYTAHYLPGSRSLPSVAGGMKAMLIAPIDCEPHRAGDVVELELLCSPENLPKK